MVQQAGKVQTDREVGQWIHTRTQTETDVLTQTDRLTQTHRQTDRKAGWQTNRQT